MKANEFKAKIIEFRKYEKLGIIIRDKRKPPHAEPVLMVGIVPEEHIVEVDNSPENYYAINAFLLMEFMFYLEEEHYEFSFMHIDNADEVHAEQERREQVYRDSLEENQNYIH